MFMPIEFIILLAGAGLILLLVHWSQVYGHGIWLFALILIPACITLIYAEAEVAKGALAILLGSLTGAISVALAIALVMLLCAHNLGTFIGKYIDNDRDENKTRYMGESWHPNGFTISGVGFLLLALIYGWLGYIRTSLTTTLLGGSSTGTVNNYIFFLYPIVTLVLGFFLAKNIKAMTEYHLKWKEVQAVLEAAKVNLIGQVSVAEYRRILTMMEASLMAGKSPTESAKQAELEISLIRRTDNQPPLPEIMANLDKDQLKNNETSGEPNPPEPPGPYKPFDDNFNKDKPEP